MTNFPKEKPTVAYIVGTEMSRKPGGRAPLNKNTLKQYRALVKEIPRIQNEIDRLEEKLEALPVVKTKVSKSMDDFPYTESHLTVEAEEPKKATEIRKQIRLKELQIEKAEKDKTAILEFINRIQDSEDRLIFEMLYINEKKMSQARIGKELGYDQSTISLKINKILKDS